MRQTGSAVVAALVAMAASRGVARADDADDTSDASTQHRHTISDLLDRPHTIAELEAGIIALPDAPISAAQQGGRTPLGQIGTGDATVQLGMHVLYRANREWAIGAGGLFGPQPTADRDFGFGGLSGLQRTHSRSYLWLGAEVRYVPLHWRSLEGWVGLTVGGVVIGDRFTTDSGEKRPTILGTKEVTMSTEGFSLGVQAGVNWIFGDRWAVGLTLRTGRWLLPSSNRCSPIGDCTTLSGTVAVFELGLSVGYRLEL